LILQENIVLKNQSKFPFFTIWYITLGYLLIHFIYGALVLKNHGLTPIQALNNWDSGWYTLIVEKGYEGPRFAFYPLYPLIVGALNELVMAIALKPLGMDPAPTPLMGAILSTVCFLGTTYLVANCQRYKNSLFVGTDTTALHLAWLLVVLNPGSYVFHTHHTESLYLLMSIAAFISTMGGAWVLGSFLGGLCALTKNQGIFVAISIGLASALLPNVILFRSRMVRFCASGLMSGLIFLVYPIFCYLKAGDFGAFYHAQMHWRPEMSDDSYWRAFFFANHWQNTNTGSLVRYGWFWLLVVGVLGLFVQRRIVFGVYSLLFVGVMPLSGEFVGTFRYSSVLFPVWFFFGWALSKLRGRYFYIVLALVFSVLCYFNMTIFRAYLLGRWSY
jgi:hypothetical protein